MKPSCRTPAQDADDARDDGHRARPGRRRAPDRRPTAATTTARISGRQRRIRPQHQDAAGPEQRVGEQRDDGRVEAVDAGHARGHGIGDADRHQHGGEHQPGDDVVAQPSQPHSRAGWRGRAASAAGRVPRCPAAGGLPVETARLEVGHRPSGSPGLRQPLPGAAMSEAGVGCLCERLLSGG